MFFSLIIVSLFLHKSAAVIYSINESEYNQMPALYAMDDFEECMAETGGTYCVLDVDLYSRNNNKLMSIIQAYSDYKMKHFNHTQIHRGICVSKSCKSYIRNSDGNVSDLYETLGECLNGSIWRQYGIEAKVSNIRYCKKEGDTIKLDISDIIMTVVYLIIIILNVIGSFYDIIIYYNGDKSGNPYLLAFSIRRNWKRLTAPSSGQESRLERLRLFHGLRTMTMVCVMFSHTVLIMAHSYVANPLYIEKSYEDPVKQILFNGSLVTHTFFVMSSFLLVYNFQLHAEKHPISWTYLPKGILLRWLRITPTYALVLATISTWMRHAYSGPLWDLVVTSEASACRQYWWAQLLYINNYVYDDAWCMPQTWYLAADTQLFCVGLLVCVAARKCKTRIITLSALFVASLLIVAAHTYFQDLDAVVIQTPEMFRNLYETDATFRLLYIRGHTNLSTYVLGLAGGFLAYHWQNLGYDVEKYKKYRWVTWLTFPMGVAVILSGGVFYIDGWQVPTTLRVLYAAFYKPVFQTIVLTFIMSCVFKVESVYRGLVEWRGWAWAGRVSYCAFLLHTMFQRALLGSFTQPLHMTDFYIIMVLSSTIFLSFMCGGALWLCVEAPAAALTRAALLAAPAARDPPAPVCCSVTPVTGGSNALANNFLRPADSEKV